MRAPQLRVYPDLVALSRAAAEQVVRAANARIEEVGRFTLALSGGSTPVGLYEQLAGPFSGRVRWTDVHLFWGDERCVPPESADSNFRLAYRTLIEHVPIPPENVHRMPAEIEPPAEAAHRYEAHLRSFFEPLPHDGPPALDLVLLGVGADGHTASLFPGGLSDHAGAWVVATEAPEGQPSRHRLSLTLSVLNQAREVVFLVSGAAKRPVLRAVLDDPHGAAAHFPAARVHPRNPPLWLVEESVIGNRASGVGEEKPTPVS